MISGDNLAEEINTAFVHVTQHLEPIHSAPLDVHNGDVYPDIQSEFIISEIDVYRKLSTISNLKSAEPDLIPNWILKSNSLALISLTNSIRTECIY